MAIGYPWLFWRDLAGMIKEAVGSMVFTASYSRRSANMLPNLIMSYYSHT
jgi:hypothetical protein